MERVFVYGTLKAKYRGEGFGEWKFVGETSTSLPYSLYDLGPFPGVRKDHLSTNGVIGELYEVPSLEPLDFYEGYPTLFDRSEIMTERGVAWMYTLKSDAVRDVDLIPSGQWPREEKGRERVI